MSFKPFRLPERPEISEALEARLAATQAGVDLEKPLGHKEGDGAQWSDHMALGEDFPDDFPEDDQHVKELLLQVCIQLFRGWFSTCSRGLKYRRVVVPIFLM